MNKSCPYCENETGYYLNQQVKRRRTFTWTGSLMSNENEEVFYEGKTMRCLACHEKVTSFVKGVHREMDNG